MMANFKPVNHNTIYQTGDVLLVKSDYWFIDHYAIVYSKDGKQYVAEGVPEGIKVEPLTDYVKRRTIIRMLRDSNTSLVTDQKVIDKIAECDKKEWKLFGFNCENFVTETCNCDIGLEQKHKWHLTGWAIIIGGFLGYLIFKGTKIALWGILIGALVVGLVIIVPHQIKRM